MIDIIQSSEINMIDKSELSRQIIRTSLNKVWLGFMVFNANYNNISVIPWQSVLLVEETGVPRESHRPVASSWTLSHNVVSSTPRHERGSNSQL